MISKGLKSAAKGRRVAAAQTSRGVFERLDAGELEIVDADDWSGVPQIEAVPILKLPMRLYRKLQAASRRQRVQPDHLAAKWLAERLRKP